MSKLDQIAALHRAMLNGGMGFDELEEYGRVNRLFRIEGLTRPQIEAACKSVEVEEDDNPCGMGCIKDVCDCGPDEEPVVVDEEFRKAVVDGIKSLHEPEPVASVKDKRRKS